MGEAIGQVLSFAVGVAVSPIPIIGVVLMLATPRARTNGPAFIAGWVAGLTVAGTIVLLVSSGADAGAGGAGADWVSYLKLALGVIATLLAAKQWRGRPVDGAEPPMPGWMKSIDRFTTGRSLAFGVVLSAANPKNLLLVVAAAAAIAQTGASTGSQAVALAAFVLIGSIGTGAPVAIYFAMGERSNSILDDLKTWMSHNNGAIMAVLLLVIGAKLVGDAISALAA